MTEIKEDPNIQWKKKKKHDKKEIVGLNTNVIEASLEEKEKKNNPASPPTTPTLSKKQLPKNLKKFRKKIRQVFDEDDEDEYEEGGMPQELELLHLQLKEQTATENTNKQNLTNHKIAQNLVQANEANKMFLQMGLKSISKKAINKSINNNTIGQNVTKQVLQEELKEKTNIKLDGLTEKEAVQTLRGVEKVDKKTLKKLDLKTIKEIGKEEKTDKEVGDIILEKTGRKENTVGRFKAKQSKLKTLHSQKSR